MHPLKLGLLCLCATYVTASYLGSGCIMENAACRADTDLLLAAYNSTNRVGCQERCRMVAGCQNWTWWADTAACQLFSACREDTDRCTYCQTGVRECGAVAKYVSIISGGLDRTADQQTQDGVTVVSETDVCEQPQIFANMATMPRHRWGHVSAFIESLFLVCGGSTEQYGGYAPNNTCDVFNVATHSWEEMEDMAECRHQAAGVGLLGKLYMTGGLSFAGDTRTSVSSMEVYDPYTRTWAPGPEMKQPLTGHCVVTHRDSFIVIGGATTMDNEGGESSMIYKFNVTTNKWSVLGNLQISRSGHGCSINERSEIIVTGGKSLSVNGKNTKSAEKLTFSRDGDRITSERFDDLPVKISHHAQIDNCRAQVYGGDVSDVGRDFVIEYAETNWEMTNVTLPENLSYHHVTPYPANFVKCS